MKSSQKLATVEDTGYVKVVKGWHFVVNRGPCIMKQVRPVRRIRTENVMPHVHKPRSKVSTILISNDTFTVRYEAMHFTY